MYTENPILRPEISTLSSLLSKKILKRVFNYEELCVKVDKRKKQNDRSLSR